MDLSSSRALVLYHKNCMDGFGAAWAFKRLMEPKFKKVEYIACQYGDSIPASALFGSEPLVIYILDFSFSKDTLKYLSQSATIVILLDHHKTALAELSNWKEGEQPENLYIEFDMNRSGAGLAWDHFAPRDLPRPMMISYIEDRDLWRFKMHESTAYNEYVKSLPFTFTDYDALYHEGFSNAVYLGRALLRNNKKIVESIVESCTEEIQIDSIRGLCCNSFGMFASDVGEQLALKSGTFGATYYRSSSGVLHFSLRSRGSVDVSDIAKKFGGGGHAKAAGFTIDPGRFIETAGGIHIYSTDESDS